MFVKSTKSFLSAVVFAAIIAFSNPIHASPWVIDFDGFQNGLIIDNEYAAPGALPELSLTWADFEMETNLFVAGEISLEVNPGFASTDVSMEPIVITNVIKKTIEGPSQRHSSRSNADANNSIELLFNFMATIFGVTLGIQFLLSYGTFVVAALMMGGIGVISLVKNSPSRKICFFTQAV